MSKPSADQAAVPHVPGAARPAQTPTTGDAVCSWLDQQTGQFDARTLQQLGRGRRAAVAEAGQIAGGRRWRWMAGAAAASLCLVLMLAVQPAAWNTEPVPPAPVSMEVFMMLASPESEDVLDSLDFYLWLESQPVDNDDRAG